jgi:hypothetical protein
MRLEYYTRLASVSLFLFSLVGLIGFVSLVPVYLSLAGELTEVTAERDGLTKLLQDPEDGVDPDAELAKMQTVTGTLNTLIHEPLVTGWVTRLLSERTEGIAFSHITVTRASRTVLLEGQALKREDLVSFSRSLEDRSDVEQENLPISDLAKNTNLRFHITVVMRPPTGESTL